MTTINHPGHGSDPGRQRGYNQDSYCLRPDIGLYLMADGVGAHLKGEVASAMVIEQAAAGLEAGESLPAALRRANSAIIAAAARDETAANMASTAVALRLDHCDYEVAWVGDSRAYLWDGRALRQLTRDHSYVQRLMDMGAISEEEAAAHPQRHVVTQALGAVDDDALQVDTITGRLARGQKILLCCDGLTDEVDDEQLTALIGAGGSDQEIVDSLIKTANDNGGSDNITVILVAAPDDAPPPAADRGGTVSVDSAALERTLRQSRRPGRALLAALTAAVLVAIAVFIFFSHRHDNGRGTAHMGGGGNMSAAPAMQANIRHDVSRLKAKAKTQPPASAHRSTGYSVTPTGSSAAGGRP